MVAAAVAAAVEPYLATLPVRDFAQRPHTDSGTDVEGSTVYVPAAFQRHQGWLIDLAVLPAVADVVLVVAVAAGSGRLDLR